MVADEPLKAGTAMPPSTAPPTNLPASLTPLVGREAEVASVAALLRDPTVRLLTLTGPGGVGKTRLALEVAAWVRAAFADGVWLVGLAPIADPGLVASAVAQVLDVREAGDEPLVAGLKTFLRDKHMLLVLDNMEQVVEAAPLVVNLLDSCPRLSVLATSRIRLRVSGEHEHAVPPLTLVEGDDAPFVERVSASAAVRLFVARARAVRSDVALTADNAAAVAAICRRLDGLPLAIELAAARVKVLPPVALLARLEARLPVLTGGGRDVPARQQTMGNAIAWSYDLLAPAERTLFRRLAVFAGGATFDAVEAVANPAGDLDVFEGLASLVDQSLVVQTETDREPRFAMLETIREFGLERLREAGEAEETRQGHAAWFLTLAERAEPELHGPAQVAWLDRLEGEHDNLRADLGWAHERGDAETGLRLAGALSRFWWQRGLFAEGRGWLERALAAEGTHSSRARAKALAGAGRIARSQGDFAAGETSHVAALALYRNLEDAGEIAATLDELGYIAMVRGEHERATVLVEEALALAREIGDRRRIARVLTSLGDLAIARADLDRAAAHFGEGLAFARAAADHVFIAFALARLGDVAVLRRDYVRAATLYEESLSLFRQARSPRQTILPLWGLGRIAWLAGDLERARHLNEEALGLARAVGDKQAIAPTLATLAALAEARGESERAAPMAEEAVAVAREVEDKKFRVDCLHRAGNAALAGGDIERARERYAEALVLVTEIGIDTFAVAPLEGLARAAAAAGEANRAGRLFGAAAARREAFDEPIPPSERELVERAVAAVRAELGEVAFAAAWREGRRLSLTAALAEAVSPAREPNPPTPDAGVRAAAGAPAHGLTPRERDVLRLVAQGLTDADVGVRLFISYRTVGRHLQSVYAKLGVGSRTAAVAVAFERGLVDRPARD